MVIIMVVMVMMIIIILLILNTITMVVIVYFRVLPLALQVGAQGLVGPGLHAGLFHIIRIHRIHI